MILASFFAKAQTKADTGKVTVVEDPRVKELVQKYADSQRGRMKGYRVQIHFGPEKAKAKEAKARFLVKHSDVPAYEPYQPPFFKIRVGDFRTKLEAYKFLQDIKNEFPGSFIVDDEIDLPRID